MLLCVAKILWNFGIFFSSTSYFRTTRINVLYQVVEGKLAEIKYTFKNGKCRLFWEYLTKHKSFSYLVLWQFSWPILSYWFIDFPWTEHSFLHFHFRFRFHFPLSANTILHHPHPCQWFFLLSQIFIIIAIFSFFTTLTHCFLSTMVAYPIKCFLFIFIYLGIRVHSWFKNTTPKAPPQQSSD